MGILRTDRVAGLGGANAIKGSVYFPYVTSGGYFHQYQQIQSDDYAFGTGNFTLECWYYMDGDGGHTDSVGNIILLTGTNTLASTSKNGVWLASRNDNKFEARVYYASGSWNMTMTSTNAFTRQTLHHIAMVRSGSSVKLYVNGVQEASGSNSSDLDTTVSTSLYIGAQGNATSTSSLGSRGITGYVSNVRVSNEALYTAAFTPPVGELQKLSSKITLCNQSPSDVLKEETGKTISLYRKTINHQLPLATKFTPHSPSTFSQYVDQGTNSGTTFDGVTTFDSQSYMVLPGSITRERYIKSTGDIVSGNLIFHLDGGDSKSYAGVTTSGDIIYDLKEGTNSTGVGIATMASGHSDFGRVTWVPDNRGCFRQSSDSDFGTITGNRIEFPQISLGNDNYTINVWVKLNSRADGGDEIMHVVSNKDGGPVSFNAHLRMNSNYARIGAQAYYSSWTYRYSTTTEIKPGFWYMLTWVNTAQYTGSMYVDGVLQKLDDGNTTWNSRTSNNTPLNSTSYATSETFDGWIGQIQFYSDTLSETEILQNYNAHKCRYIY